MKNNSSYLTLIFTSVDVSQNFLKRRARRNNYWTSISSILRWTHDLGDTYLVDNTGFFDHGKGVKFIQSLNVNELQVHSLLENLGKLNKGLGELSMLKEICEKVDIFSYEKILFFTGRHFLTCPFVINESLESSSDIVVAKPIFFQLNGLAENDGDTDSINDMFFCMKPEYIREYLDYFTINASRLESMQIGSEQLLFEFLHKNQSSLKAPVVKFLPALGVIRFGMNLRNKIVRLEIL